MGSNFITNTGGEGISTYETDPSTYASIRHNLTITGDGSLTISQDTPWYGYGIYCTGDLTLDGVDIGITSAASAIWTQWEMSITNCDITILSDMNGLVSNNGGSASAGDNGRGRITLQNSVIDITANEGNSNCILLGNDVTGAELVVDSGDIKLNGVKAINGIDGSLVNFNGGVIELTASDIAADVPASCIRFNNGMRITLGTLNSSYCKIERALPVIIKGENGKWIQNSDNGLFFTSDAAFSDFLSVTVDGEMLMPESFNAYEGSTVIELKTSYLSTLAEGTHILSVNSTGGSAVTEFTVGASSPRTGDSSALLFISVIAAVCLVVLGGVLNRAKERS